MGSVEDYGRAVSIYTAIACATIANLPLELTD
jgi:hypothetical protein